MKVMEFFSPELSSPDKQRSLIKQNCAFFKTQVLQENMDLAEEILSDLNSMFRDDRRPSRGARMLQQDLEIDPDDPKRLLRIS